MIVNINMSNIASPKIRNLSKYRSKLVINDRNKGILGGLLHQQTGFFQINIAAGTPRHDLKFAGFHHPVHFIIEHH